MPQLKPPYFFDEFLLPIKRDEPTPRERTLGLTVKDLEWLPTLYYATDTARQDSTEHKDPMRVEKLLLGTATEKAIVLAGSFIMSPTPDEAKAVLYTPYGGLEVFDDRAQLLEQVQARLNDATRRVDLLRFLSIGQRDALPHKTPISVTATAVTGAVMEDQQDTILASQQMNVEAMLAELRKLPTLGWMLDTLLGIMAHSYFPDLDQADTRVNCFIPGDPTHAWDKRWVDSLPLRDALLQFYARQGWPEGQTRAYFNPRHDTRTFTEAQLAQDLQRWENLVEQTAGILSRLLASLMQTYWNDDVVEGRSRLSFFAQVASDKFRADLLFKRQDGIVSSSESHELLAMFLPDKTSRTAHTRSLSVDKVRVHAPFQHYVELASTLMINNTNAYLYTQSRGLQVLKDLNDLKDTLLAMLKAAGHEDELLNFLSLDERSVFIGLEDLQVSGRPVVGNVFTEMVEDIIAKQLSNLEHALGLFRRSAGSVNLAALLDSALDVRTMLDNRLLALDADGRWTVHPVTTGNGRPTTVQAERARQRLQQLRSVEAALAQAREKHPTLRRLVTDALNEALEKRRLALKADETFINTYPSPAQEREGRLPKTSVSLIDHFIARLTKQAEPLLASPLSGFYGKRSEGAADKLKNLTLATVNALIKEVVPTFTDHVLRSLPRLYLDTAREHLSHAMLLGLSGEAELRRLGKTLERPIHELLDTVLHANNLTRLTRRALNGFVPDAFSLSLKVGKETALHALANSFVLTARGGTDADHSGEAVLWTPRCGYEGFASIHHLLDELTQRLKDPLKRLPLLETLPISQRRPHQTWRLGPLQRIDEHLLNSRQQSHSDSIADGIEHLLSLKLGAKSLQDSLDALIQQAAPTNLPRAIAIAQSMVGQQALPVWLGMAPYAEQHLHAELLEQYHDSCRQNRDYLHGIIPMREHAFSELSKLLEARFPGQVINPDNVLIPARINLPGNVQTLTDFALRCLPELRADGIRPRSRTATPLPAALDGSAVVQMVLQLGLMKTYQQLLTNHLKSDTEDSHTRRALFCRQLPWQLLQYAHEQRLQERLSATAWSFIQQIFDMPDAVARAALSGATAIIRPLALIATPGATLAKAVGSYLIGPQAGSPGPLVLFAPHSPQHVLKEYPSEKELLNEFTRPGALQEWVIGQLESAQQATYRNLLRQPSTTGPSEIRLGAAHIAGNVLKHLYKDNADLLHRLLSSQFKQGGNSQWDAVTSLLTKDIPKALQFMAGKLAYPLVVWRSYKLFKSSAEDLQQHRWSSAFKAFIGGLAELAFLRKELDRLLPADAPPKAEQTVKQWLEAPLPAAPTLATLDITAPQRTQLKAFEDHDVALNELNKSQKTQVYKDDSTSRHYVPVAGKVYQVRKAGENWCLSHGGQQGPFVQRNTDGDWVLDLDRHDPRYGKTLSRYASRVRTRSAERDSINIEAVGIRAIAAVSSWKAQCINEALNVATYYAVTCKRNVLLFSGLRDPASRTGRFFTDMFGVPSFSLKQVERITTRIDQVLEELMNHTLIGPDSQRFVSGTHRYSSPSTFAFVLADDLEKKIYLLDRFFDPQMDVYQNCLTTPFDLSAHARASTLIHEISHLKCSSEDLAYLDSMRPFPDLINATTPHTVLMKTDLFNLRDTALSVLTPATMLFKTWDDFTQSDQDYSSSAATGNQKKKVLSTTGGKTLQEARQIFMSDAYKRIDTILANADSITYLITHLGRALDVGA